MDHLAPSSGVNWYSYSPFGELVGGSQLPPMELGGLEVGRHLAAPQHLQFAAAPQVGVGSAIHYIQDDRPLNLIDDVQDGPEDTIVLPLGEAKPTGRVRAALGEKIACYECGATFACGANLRNHLRIHTGERPYICEECGASFTQRSNLRSHKRVHTGERPYMCGICGQTFARSSHLPGHMRTHTGEKPFNCPHCGRSFATNQIMKNHLRTHTGERPFVCDVCDATFAQSSCLATHKKIHTGERNFKCNECGKAFISRSGLQTHERVHTGEKPYTCEKCDKSFKTSSYLSKHKQKYCGNNGYKNRVLVPVVKKPDVKKPDRKQSNGRKFGKSADSARAAVRPPRKFASKRVRRSQRLKIIENVERVNDNIDLADTNGELAISAVDFESKEVKTEGSDSAACKVEHVGMRIDSALYRPCRFQENQDPLEMHYKDEECFVETDPLVMVEDMKQVDKDQYELSEHCAQISLGDHSDHLEEEVSNVLHGDYLDASDCNDEDQLHASQVLLDNLPVHLVDEENPHLYMSRNGDVAWYS